jgi:tripartite-type tricarboxylate transporter receptor subunit TctC
MQQGKLRILGVSGDKRSPFMPKVPTFIEQGYPKIRGVENYGIFAPPRTPDATVQSLHASIVAAAKDPALRSAFEQVGLETLTLPPGEYAKQLQAQREFWRPIVQASGFRSED